MDPLICSLCLGMSVAALAFCWLLGLTQLVRALQAPDIQQEVEAEAPYWKGSSYLPLLSLVRVSARLFTRYEKSKTGQQFLQKLVMVGNPMHLRAADFMGICLLVASALGGLAFLIGLSAVVSLGVSLTVPIFLGIFAGLIGAATPRFYLNSEAAHRLRSINNDLPYAMDFMLLMIEGGATIQEAFEAISREGSFGPLGEELALVNREIQYGSVLSQALTNLAQRMPSDDLTVIVQAINQGLVMGTPISNILRDQSDLLRLKRSQNAEEMAKKAGSKMTFPVILIMVATFLMILGPAMMYIVKMQKQ